MDRGSGPAVGGGGASAERGLVSNDCLMALLVTHSGNLTNDGGVTVAVEELRMAHRMLEDGVTVASDGGATDVAGSDNGQADEGQAKMQLFSIGIRAAGELQMGDGTDFKPSLTAKRSGAIQDGSGNRGG